MKKLISILLTTAILMSCTPIFAEENVYDDGYEEAQKKIAELSGDYEQVTPIPISEVQADTPASEEQEDAEYKPFVHEESLNVEMKLSEEEMKELEEAPENLQYVNSDGISAMSTDNREQWKSMFAEQFGAAYLSPYIVSDNTKSVNGNSNRMIIEETDLKLSGKNGLDFVLNRKSDNQDYTSNFRTVSKSNENITIQEYIVYAFTNKTDNSTIYVGFLTEDWFYEYMYNGCYMSKISDTTRKYKCTIQATGEEVLFYKFEDIYKYIGINTSDKNVVYNSSLPRGVVNVKGKNIYYLINEKLMSGSPYSIGQGWDFVMPMAGFKRYDYTRDKTTTSTRVNNFYNGVFRDVYGSIYSLDIREHYTMQKTAGAMTMTGYSSSIVPDDNKALRFELSYMPKELYSSGPKYNLAIYDGKEALTYYLYNPTLVIGNEPNISRQFYIIAIKDNYGNMIRYEYSDGNFDKLSKVIDTYGREINFVEDNGTTTVSYYDDTEGKTKTITYKREELAASALDNDSPLKHKPVKRLTVTNENGDSTIYDSRETTTLCYVCANAPDINNFTTPYEDDDTRQRTGYNVERIKYPTGAESRYKYKYINIHNDAARTCYGVYAVEESHELVDGKQTDTKEYSFENANEDITNTLVEKDSDRKTVTQYNYKGLRESTHTSPISTYAPYRKVSYYYKSDNYYPYRLTTDNNGKSTSVEYEYDACKNIISEKTGLKKTQYTYHTIKNPFDTSSSVYTSIPSSITQGKVKDKDWEVDYKITTTINDKGSVTGESVEKDGIIKAKTAYEYDSCGELLSTKQWTDDTNKDGVLDENDNVMELSSATEASTQKTKTTTTIIANVLNADGTDEGNITTNYKYNIYGSPTSQTDPYGTITTIEYDNINRPTTYNFPNGGKKLIEYNAAKKYSIVTDEAGVKLRYNYDGLGRLTTVQKNGATIEAHAYDNAGREIEKITYRAPTTGTKEVYSYDCLDRMIKKQVYELSSKLLYTENYTYKFIRLNASSS